MQRMRENYYKQIERESGLLCVAAEWAAGSAGRPPAGAKATSKKKQLLQYQSVRDFKPEGSKKLAFLILTFLNLTECLFFPC